MTTCQSQKKGLKRNTIDKFYTNVSYALKCVEYVKKYVDIHTDDIFIEPSAGNGSFIKEIKTITNNYFFYDIEPDHTEIVKQDFLLLNTSIFSGKKVHIIGNPPFGRQSSMAIHFIKKSCEFAESISFILPKSFKKDSMKNKFTDTFHLIWEEDVPPNSFVVNGKSYDVPCVFQIWKKQDVARILNPKQNPVGFQFVKKNESPDISFRRVGVYAGKIETNIDKSEQSHYFIQFTNEKLLCENINKLQNIQFQTNNTVGPKSISKQELIEEFNKVL